MSLSFLIAPPRVPRPVVSVRVIDGKKVKKSHSGARMDKEYFKAYYKRNREAIAAKRAKEVGTERVKATRRRTYLRHREKVLAKCRAYREEHREHYRAVNNAYHAAHRDEINAKRRAKYAAKKANQVITQPNATKARAADAK